MNGRWRPPIHSFIFKLLLYMLLSGVVPFGAALFYYDHQSAGRSTDSYAKQAEQSHKFLMQQVQNRLKEMIAAAEVLASDIVLQYYFRSDGETNEGVDGQLHHQEKEMEVDMPSLPLKEPEGEKNQPNQNAEIGEVAGLYDQQIAPEDDLVFDILSWSGIEDLEIRRYIKELILRQSRRLGDETQICLLGTEKERSICIYPDVRFADMEMIGTEAAFMPIDIRDSYNRKDYELMYSTPLAHNVTEYGQARVVIITNFSRLVSDILTAEQLYSNGIVIFDGKGDMLYRNSLRTDGDFSRGDQMGYGVEVTAQTITTKQTFQLNGEEWVSLLQVKNQHDTNRNKVLTNVVLMFIVLLILVCAGGAFLFSRSIAKPLHRLRTVMNRAERGDLKAYWVHDNSQEIDDVGQSYNQMLNRLEDLINQVKREEALKKEAEIAALQYQLNPHFLYNTLNTIKWVAKLHKTPQISEVVSALVRLLQASLGKKGDFITLREEVGLINDYMEIQRFRYGDRVHVRFELEPITERCLVPRMILQPLVENACIHGIEPSKREGLIIIRAWIDRDLLFCQVEDNGIGMDPEIYEGGSGKREGWKERMSGIGLKHIREKIKLYYGPDYKMHVISKKGKGTTIRLSLPIHQSEV